MAYGIAPTSSQVAKQPKGKVTAKTESKTLIAANKRRLIAFVTNSGGKDVWLALGPTAVAEEGIKLVATTGAAVIEAYSGEIACVTKEGESVVSFAEV